MTVVLDASAVLVVIHNEPGADLAAGLLKGGSTSAANYSEVVAKLVDAGLGDNDIIGLLDALGLEVHPLDAVQAQRAGLLRRQTRKQGLSLGDRACLALAAVLNLPAMTADRSWAELDLEVKVMLIR